VIVGIFEASKFNYQTLQHEVPEVGAKIVEDEAKRVIGTYDYG
jgi:hypothetical protein